NSLVRKVARRLHRRGGTDEDLLGHAAPKSAGAAKRPGVDNRDAPAGLAAARGHGGGDAGADDDQVVLSVHGGSRSRPGLMHAPGRRAHARACASIGDIVAPMPDIPRTADIVIIGGGVHGASLAYHLARKNAGRVLLVEKKFIASGPTGRSTALVRRFYAMDFFTRTASAAAEMFRHWKDVVGGDGDPGFQQVGMLALAGPDNAPHLRHNAMQAQKVGARVQLISPAEVKALVPAANIDDIALASYEAESGYADPSSTANALANRARELGATLVQYRQVDAIRTAGQKVVGVRSEGVDIDAPVVVNCAGLWADRLLRPLGVEVSIKPERHQMCFFRRPSGFGVHPAVADSIQMTYMRPEHGDLTIHGKLVYDEIVDPDAYNEGADPD